MNHYAVLGEWLGRSVTVINVPPEPPFSVDGIEASVVLLVLKSEMPEDSVRLLLKALVRQQPLAIVTNGVGARSAFNVLVDEVSDGSKRKHVMTNVLEESDLHEAVETLLDSTWPSEERFDEWVGYAIMAVGGEGADVEAAVKARIGATAPEPL